MKKITRRQFAITCSAGLASAALAKGETVAADSTKHPNIIFLLTDDQRWDTLGCMGNDIIQTPHIDAMASEGVVFDNAFITTSICAPSRATYLSGQYVCHHGINGFQQTFSDEQWAATYPAMLREAGYATGFVGKYGVGGKMPEDKFTFWRGYPGQGHYEQKDEQGNHKHLTQVHEEAALEFLRDYSGKQPFCLSVSFKAPHCQDGDPRQFIYDPRYAELYKDVTIPPVETNDDQYYERFPEFFRKKNEARKRWEIRFSEPDLYQEMVRGYYRLITGVDRVVGALRAELETQGVADNTVIVYMADNGFFLGEHGLAGKWYGYDPSIRVPLVVYDPRLPETQRGRRCAEMALNTDIAPTILSLAGITPPEVMQGRDLSPLIEGQQTAWRDDFYYEHSFEHPAIPKSDGVVGKRFKYLRYYEQTPVYEELFDREEDPQEINNLAVDPNHAELLNRMRERCAALKAQYS